MQKKPEQPPMSPQKEEAIRKAFVCGGINGSLRFSLPLSCQLLCFIHLRKLLQGGVSQ
jgi:hypothetical protein